ncbi:MAG: hypothetical protein IPH71_13275 [Proteobacteria bacterium]|jgi:hypothetical protein|nr:hypothetical protein [Pseudomonadota bacterium]MBK7116969.1 hypothetical protein [Pseudomonadota bacterium]MCC6632819.1 hypothetical protein [Gammaproteobacteria bacterium]
MKRNYPLFVGVVLLASPLLSGAAQSSPASEGEAPAQRELLQPPKMRVASPITDRLAVNIRFFMPSIATDVRYDASDGTPGTPLTGEGTLGLEDQLKQGAIDLQFRMVDRHRIRAQFYKQTRGGDVVLNQQVRFGDDVYIVNDRVVSKMDLRKLDLVYTYSFLRREKIELSAGLGIHLLQAQGTLDAPARFVSENLDVAGPFATLAFDGTWRFTKRFSLNAQVNYLKGHVDTVRGSYKAWNADVQFRLRPNFTLGAGYSATRFYLDSSEPGDAGLFRFDYKGPQAFIRVSL